MHMETLELLHQFVQQRGITPMPVVSPESRLEDLGIDSLNLLRLMFDMEDHYGVRMPDDLPRPITVGELIATFERLKSASHG